MSDGLVERFRSDVVDFLSFIGFLVLNFKDKVGSVGNCRLVLINVLGSIPNKFRQWYSWSIFFDFFP